MTKIRVDNFTISIDGYSAGPHQSLENPLGEGGEKLHQWLASTKTFQQQVLGKSEGTTGVDNEFAEKGFENIGAWIMGRNMFSPYRGKPNAEWKGWWGGNPPYHAPVFILTHHARPSIEMEGDTTFHFITDGIHEALERAREAAKEKDIRILGGASTIQQFLREGLIDQVHIAVSPILLGSGEHLCEGLDLKTLGYECTEYVASEKATHVVLSRQS